MWENIFTSRNDSNILRNAVYLAFITDLDFNPDLATIAGIFKLNGKTK